MKRILYLFIILASAFSFACAQSPRKINPVKNPATITQSKNEAKKDTLDLSKFVHRHDENGNTIYVDTITGKEFIDSTQIQAIPKMIYPLIHSASVSVDFWSPLMRLFNTSYGLIGFAGQINMHNRYIPTLEFGLGKADNTPVDNNFTYRSPMSVYFKIGADYNFLYNSNPDYFVFAGIRYGFTPFKYQITNILLNDPYWGESQTIDMPSISTSAGYIELLFGLKVKIFKDWSLGWNFRYHKIIHGAKNAMGDPWYIPGYGTRGSSIGGSFSLYYTLPIDKWTKKKNKSVDPVTVDDTLPPVK